MPESLFDAEILATELDAITLRTEAWSIAEDFDGTSHVLTGALSLEINWDGDARQIGGFTGRRRRRTH